MRIGRFLVLLVALVAGGRCSAAYGAPDGGRIDMRTLDFPVPTSGEYQWPELEYLFLAAGTVTADQAEELHRLGITVVSVQDCMVHVRGPVPAFRALGPGSSLLPWVTNVVASPYQEVLQAAPAEWLSPREVSEAVGAADMQALGHTGQGVNVAVIDVGFTGDILAELGAERVHYCQLGLGQDGQSVVLVQGYSSFGGGEHGEACARAVLDVAPDANLYLLSAPTVPEWAKILIFLQSGSLTVEGETVMIDVLSDSTGCPIPFDHADGRGLLAQLADTIVIGGGVLYVNALGNYASGEDTLRSFFAGTFEDADGDGRLDLTPAVEDDVERNTIALGVSLRDWIRTHDPYVSLALEWDGWSWLIREDAKPEEWEPADFGRIQDLDLIVYYLRESTGELVEVARMDTPQLKRPAGGGLVKPLETTSFALGWPGRYLIAVENATERYPFTEAVSRPVEVHLYVSSNVSLTVPEHTTAGSLLNVAGAREVLGVGAVEFSAGKWCVAPYSSCGPTSDSRMKPEVAAPTGYESVEYEPWGLGFTGTSASAPVVAGVAALVIGAARDEGIKCSARDVRDAILGSATPLCEDQGCNSGCISISSAAEAFGYRVGNYHVGFGLVNAEAAFRALMRGH